MGVPPVIIPFRTMGISPIFRIHFGGLPWRTVEKPGQTSSVSQWFLWWGAFGKLCAWRCDRHVAGAMTDTSKIDLYWKLNINLSKFQLDGAQLPRLLFFFGGGDGLKWHDSAGETIHCFSVFILSILSMILSISSALCPRTSFHAGWDGLWTFLTVGQNSGSTKKRFVYPVVKRGNGPFPP